MADAGEREFGIIKCYLPMKGYGFIRRNVGRDVFFLRTDAPTEAALIEGATVSFLVHADKKGPRAREVQREG